MPFYEYQCSNCGHSLEAMQKVSDPALKKCPSCGKSQLRKLMSAPVFRLKGGGWYETDFKSDQDAKRNLADRPEADAPKEEKKEAPGASKEAAAEASKPDKAADKPAEKATTEAKKKADSGAPAAASAPARSSAVNKSHSRTKRPARIKRPAAKPARR